MPACEPCDSTPDLPDEPSERSRFPRDRASRILVFSALIRQPLFNREHMQLRILSRICKDEPEPQSFSAVLSPNALSIFARGLISKEAPMSTTPLIRNPSVSV